MSDFEIFAWPIIGIPNIYCAIDISTLNEGTPLELNVEQSTWSNGNWSEACGYYVEYSWKGVEDSVEFSILTMDSLKTVMGGITFFSLLATFIS